MTMKRYLVLENGKVFEGEAFGADGEVIAEIVFTTAMTAYLETLTDKSYKGQAVVQTFPLIGNYGIIPEDREGEQSSVSAYIVREVCEAPSNFRCAMTIDQYLKQQGIPGLKGIDSRSLTKILREHGTMNGMICDDPTHADLDKISSYRIKRPVDEVTVRDVRIEEPSDADRRYSVALIDYGVKENIIRSLTKRGCKVTVLPSSVTAAKIRDLSPDGLFLSNGPGDPEDNEEAIATLRELSSDNIPTMGICLGHQLLALAHGFKTSKLKYGHRGANHPVRDLTNGRVYISSQNHGYAVESGSIDKDIADEFFVNCNDFTNEGLIYKNENAFSVQFHPEACGGPKDTDYLFDRFIEMMERRGE